jgi:hypothetical protein
MEPRVRSPELTVKLSPASRSKVCIEIPFKATRFSGLKVSSAAAAPGFAHAERRAVPASAESVAVRTKRRLEIDIAASGKIEFERPAFLAVVALGDVKISERC